MEQITYGPGGYDPDAPDGNVLAREQIADGSPPEPTLADLAAEVAAMKARVAAVEVSNADARAVRDAVAGNAP